ncbi:uncharacterized protein LOC112518471 [Cynara cardunculus var. scolymus]|uniref:uncharacterized protein LOC112518471 n=1 Tax=Cynara cardunculus var. scolymus TaxID=59895 RepID=UPI000D6290FE|nr:uncharacterized protein LOC112518471 [Cynara cardunculus var. scolymus]
MSSIIVFTFSILLLSTFAISSLLDAADNGGNDNFTAYQVIQSYGFPKGIIPIGVIGYELDKPTGKFKAFFNGSCSFSLEGSYDLKYQSTIGGIISNGRLKDLTGVSVKVFFFWLNIVEVYRTEDELGFSVGIASAGFPIDNFEICPQCGCGLNCNGVVDDHEDKQVQKIRTNTIVSSI